MGGAGGSYRSVTPDRVFISPCSSRPQTPPPFPLRNADSSSRPQTPVRVDENYNRNQYSGTKYAESRTDDRRDNRRHAEDRRGGGRLNQIEERKGEEVPKEKTPPRGGFRKSLEAQLSPVSPVTPEETVKPLVTVSSTILVSAKLIRFFEYTKTVYLMNQELNC